MRPIMDYLLYRQYRKLFEECYASLHHVYTAISDHLDEIHLLSDCQWRFKAARSTVAALLAATSHWFSLLEAGEEIICVIFLTIEKHLTLCHTKQTQDSECELWFTPLGRSYLTSRSQCVIVDDRSSIVQILPGVPQESVLRPFLFLIYIDENSTPMSPESSWAVYADDVCIYGPLISSCSDFRHV